LKQLSVLQQAADDSSSKKQQLVTRLESKIRELAQSNEQALDSFKAKQQQENQAALT
jgi:hypothetical protein